MFIRRARQRGEIGTVDVLDAGDQVIVVLETEAGDADVPRLRANLTTFRDGKVVEMVAHESPQDALAAARS